MPSGEQQRPGNEKDGEKESHLCCLFTREQRVRGCAAAPHRLSCRLALGMGDVRRPTRPRCRGPCGPGGRAAPACVRGSRRRQGTRGCLAPAPSASSTRPRTSGLCCLRLRNKQKVTSTERGSRPGPTQHTPVRTDAGTGHVSLCAYLKCREQAGWGAQTRVSSGTGGLPAGSHLTDLCLPV